MENYELLSIRKLMLGSLNVSYGFDMVVIFVFSSLLYKTIQGQKFA